MRATKIAEKEINRIETSASKTNDFTPSPSLIHRLFARIGVMRALNKDQR
jgi:hypothetical protein